MNSFEFNKMAGAVLSAMLLVMVIGLVTDGIFHAEVPEQPAYFVELPDTGDTATAEAEVEQGPTLAELLVLGDVGRGDTVRPARRAAVGNAGAPVLTDVVRQVEADQFQALAAPVMGV